MFSWISDKKPSIKLLELVVVIFSVGDTPRRSTYPAIQVHPIQKNPMIFGSICAFSVTNGIAGQRVLSAKFLIRYPKTFILRFLVESFWIAAPKRPFSRLEILEESTWLVRIFATTKSNIKVPLKKYEKWPSPCQPCSRNVHFRRAAPRLQKSVELLLIWRSIHREDYGYYEELGATDEN